MSEVFNPGGLIVTPGGPVLVTTADAECVLSAADLRAGRIRCRRSDARHLRTVGLEHPDLHLDFAAAELVQADEGPQAQAGAEDGDAGVPDGAEGELADQQRDGADGDGGAARPARGGRPDELTALTPR